MTQKPKKQKKNSNTNSIIQLVEKRVRKDIRIHKKIGKEKTILLYNNNSKEYRTAKEILKSIFGNIKQIKSVKEKKGALIPTNLDREINNYLNAYFKFKTLEKKKHMILDNVLEQEIIDYCKAKNILGGKRKDYNEFIEEVEKATPQKKFAIKSSFEKIFLKLKTDKI